MKENPPRPVPGKAGPSTGKKYGNASLRAVANFRRATGHALPYRPRGAKLGRASEKKFAAAGRGAPRNESEGPWVTGCPSTFLTDSEAATTLNPESTP